MSLDTVSQELMSIIPYNLLCSNMKDVQYSGGLKYNLEGYYQYSGGCQYNVEGYHQYSGVCQCNVEGHHQCSGGVSALSKYYL